MSEQSLLDFAGDLVEEYEGKGYRGSTLFMAMVQLLAQDDPQKAANALCIVDDMVSKAQRMKQRCRTPV